MAGILRTTSSAPCSTAIFSENLAGYINQGEWDAGNADFYYASMPDAEAEMTREGLIEEKGFFKLMPPLSRFSSGNRAAKKQVIVDKLRGFFDRFFGIGDAIFTNVNE